MDGSDDDDDVDVAGEHADEEEGDHDEGPNGAGYEGLFLFVVVGLRGLLLLLYSVSKHVVCS